MSFLGQKEVSELNAKINSFKSSLLGMHVTIVDLERNIIKCRNQLGEAKDNLNTLIKSLNP